MRPSELPGLVAVVTGASSGIGRRIASDLDRFGAAVVAVARREDRLEELAAGFVTPGGGWHACDVSDTDAYAHVIRQVEASHGHVDILVQAAAKEQRIDALDADTPFFRDMFATNFFAAVAGTLAVLPGMVARRLGYVLNVSSDHGRAPGPGTAPYCASKAALSAFTESVAHEVRGRGVHAHVLYPGWVDTDLGRGAVEAGMPMPPKAVRRTEAQVSRAAIEGLGGASIDVNAAPLGALAPVARALAPALYRRGIERASR